MSSVSSQTTKYTNAIYITVLLTASVLQFRSHAELLKVIVVLNFETDLLNHRKAPHTSTFSEYFWMINTIKHIILLQIEHT